jgi:hypothetical protein
MLPLHFSVRKNNRPLKNTNSFSGVGVGAGAEKKFLCWQFQKVA